PLDHDKSQELFSDAYVRAVVSAASMHVITEAPTVDRDSIDGWIQYTGLIGDVYSPPIAYQLKSSRAPSHLRDDHIAYPLAIKNYTDLRVENTPVARILIVVIVPQTLDQWIVQDE